MFFITTSLGLKTTTKAVLNVYYKNTNNTNGLKNKLYYIYIKNYGYKLTITTVRKKGGDGKIHPANRITPSTKEDGALSSMNNLLEGA